MAFPPQMLLALCAYAMGFAAAIPVGATQLEIARRALQGYVAAALMVMCGSVSSDILYGIIAFFGFAPFLREPRVVAIFLLISGAISSVLGVWIIRTNTTTHPVNVQYDRVMQAKRLSYVTGFSLAFTNPLMIAWWLLGAQVLTQAEIMRTGNLTDTLFFLFPGALGIASYHIVLAIGVSKAKRFLTEQTIRKITAVFGVVLIMLAGYLIVRGVMQLR